MKQTNKPQITIGIPTYYGDPSIIKTVKSIIASVKAPDFRVVVSVDGNPLKPKVKSELIKLGVKVIENKTRGGQVTRIKQIISLTDTPYLVLTQDDVLFEPQTLQAIVTAFKTDSRLTMIGCRILPLRTHGMFERIVEVGVMLTHRIGQSWKAGNNYLLASGRCLAFRTEHIKKFVIVEEVINSDAYLYFENKRQKGVFAFVPEAVVLNKSPQTLAEHRKQHQKFQVSQGEISRYLHQELASEYQVPQAVVFKALMSEWMSNPVFTSGYLVLSFLMKFNTNNPFAHASRFWDTDVSTKQI